MEVSDSQDSDMARAMEHKIRQRDWLDRRCDNLPYEEPKGERMTKPKNKIDFMTKPKYVFVLGTELWAEPTISLFGEPIVWGWHRRFPESKLGSKYGFLGPKHGFTKDFNFSNSINGCDIAKKIIKIPKHDLIELWVSAYSAPNKSAILPLEI